LLLALLATLRWWSPVTGREPRVDEAVYLAAFEAVGRGESPYVVPDFFYAPALAVLGAWSLDLTSQGVMLAAMRIVNLAGVALTCWLPFTLLDITVLRRLALAAAVLLLAPGTGLALEAGNLSPAAVALVVAALLHWPRHPVSSGLAYGASLVIKPLAVVGIPVLALHRPRPPGRAHQVAGAASVLGAALLLIGFSYLPDFLALGASLDHEGYPLVRTVSTHRLLFNLGLDVDRSWLSALVGAAGVVLARARRWSRDQLLCLAVAAIVLASPALWSHTLLLTLPLQVLAAKCVLGARLVRSAGSDAGSPRWSGLRRWELPALLVAIAALHWSEGVGGLGPGPSVTVALALAPPLLATAGLAAFVLGSRCEEGI
jgi:Glycosyltransferase family 87